MPSGQGLAAWSRGYWRVQGDWPRWRSRAQYGGTRLCTEVQRLRLPEVNVAERRRLLPAGVRQSWNAYTRRRSADMWRR